MIISDVVNLAKSSFLYNLPVAKNDNTILMFTYLGLIELYKRFNLSIKVETIETNTLTSIYDLRSSDVNVVFEVYNSKGRKLQKALLAGDDSYDYKQLNYRSFLLTKPQDEVLYFVYKASPAMITMDSPLDLPMDMLNVLLDYIAYKGHSTINKDGTNESSIYYSRFDKGCIELENRGYVVDLSTAVLPIQFKGFI